MSSSYSIPCRGNAIFGLPDPLVKPAYAEEEQDYTEHCGKGSESIGVRATPMTFDMTDRGIGTSERLWRRSSQ